MSTFQYGILDDWSSLANQIRRRTARRANQHLNHWALTTTEGKVAFAERDRLYATMSI
jgi:hypothetical protein